VIGVEVDQGVRHDVLDPVVVRVPSAGLINKRVMSG
jgi:hypothetical protein